MADKQDIRDNATEGVYVVPTDTKKKIARAKVLQARINRDDAELKQIKNDLKEEMTALAVKQYTGKDGVPLATIFDRTSSSFDRTAAEKALGAKVIGKFYTSNTSTSLRLR